MTVRGENRIDWNPVGVGDTIDGDVSRPGLMNSLENLIFDPSTPRTFNCRPAVRQINDMSGITGATTASVGIISDDIIYGMVASTLNIGYDQPFAYDINTDSFLSISGITSTNVPVSQDISGDWVPPTMVELGSRAFVTHPGFSFPNCFGYIDFTGFSSTILADTLSGNNVLNGNFFLDGIGPGYIITGSGIPVGTVVVDMTPVSITTIGTTHSNTTIDGIPSTTGMYVGQSITGPGIPVGTTIASVLSGVAITISQAATASNTGQAIFVTGSSITMSHNSTGTANNSTISISGGTSGNPLWCAGNTTQNHLVGVATTVNTFNNRLYFSVENSESWTDTLSTNMTLSTQTLFIGDSSSIVAVAQMPLSTTSQAVIEGLMVYKVNSINQITGDSALGNLAVNEVSPNVGTDSPRSIVNTPEGQMFKAVDGIRLIEFSGLISEPDKDLSLPFIYAQYPTRVSAEYNTNIYRICVQNGKVAGAPFQEYWFDLKNAGWTGPHSFPQDLALPYKSTFILFSNRFAPGIYQSDVVLNQGGNIDNFEEFGVTEYVAEDGITQYVAEDGITGYIAESNLSPVLYVAEDGITQYVAEDGTTAYIAEDLVGNTLTWDYQTVPMTDGFNFYANTLLNSTIEIALPQLGNPVQFTAYDEGFNQLNQVVIQEQLNAPIWGEFNWGAAIWGATTAGLEPTSVPWSQPFEYNRLVLDIQGTSALDLKIGPLHMMQRPLNYIKR